MSDIAILLEDLNGEHSFSSERAAFGYVQPWERLPVTRSVIDRCMTDEADIAEIPLDATAALELMKLSFLRLRNGGMQSDQALRIAFLRTKWIRNGNLFATRESRCTPIDEVDIVPAPDVADLLAYFTEDEPPALTHVDDIEFARVWENFNAEEWNAIGTNLWAIVAHVFRVRGHHYKDELENLYQKTWRGTTLSFPDSHWTWASLARTAIHSFGIKALEVATRRYASIHALTANLMLRRNAIPCGSALVGTTYAALMSFQSTPFYASLTEAYGTQIENLMEDHEELVNLGLRAHISASLYGLKRVEVRTEAAAALAPLLVGYIRTMPAQSAIKNQKSLDKHADTNPMMAEIMRNWLEGVLSRVGKEKTLAGALGQVREDEED